MLESRKRKSWVLLVLLCQFYGKRNWVMCFLFIMSPLSRN
jgi:hypothetical protein